MSDNRSYTDFASVYDNLTGDVQYEKRCDYLEALFEKHALSRPGLVCDLGCGTGSVCDILSQKGYDMIGIDSSEEMLCEAIEKKNGKNILYLNQDMCDFELYGTVDVFLSLLDSVNYITDPDELSEMFALVHNYLNPEGLFIFDVNTEHKFRDVLGENVFVNEEDNVFYTWENFFDGEFCDFRLNFFVKREHGYERFTEEHSQRYYSRSELEALILNSGFRIEAVYGDMKFESPDADEERIFYVIRAIK